MAEVLIQIRIRTLNFVHHYVILNDIQNDLSFSPSLRSIFQIIEYYLNYLEGIEWIQKYSLSKTIVKIAFKIGEYVRLNFPAFTLPLL